MASREEVSTANMDIRLDSLISTGGFSTLATGQSDIHCKIKEALLIRDLKLALNNVMTKFIINNRSDA